MSLPWCPRFVVGDIDYTFALPMRPPTPRKAAIGGSETSATGVPASYVVRRDYLLAVPLRFEEEDWGDVEYLIDTMQDHAVEIEFFPDAEEVADSYFCWLESPGMGEAWEPSRSDELGGGRGYEVTVVLRSVLGPWDVRYFSDVLEDS
jgi:hypothetical protein